jgi:CelD/BcsL family acetyltransferase involved in cellulose biosynthesis
VFDAMLEELDQSLGRNELVFRYLPPAFPAAELAATSRHRSRMLSRPFGRPVMDLTSDAAGESLKKKGNKSKLNRLKRLGEVRFEVVEGVEGLDMIFDEVITQYDSRRLAVNGFAPFANDPNKRPFHVELMRQGLLHVCVLRVGDKVAAAHLGVRGTHDICLAIVSFDNAFAEESPNKLMLLLLAQHLASQGYHIFDLTPGGDAWKNLMGNRFDEVVELRVFRTPAARMLTSANQAGRRLLKSAYRKYVESAVHRVKGRPPKQSA